MILGSEKIFENFDLEIFLTTFSIFQKIGHVFQIFQISPISVPNHFKRMDDLDLKSSQQLYLDVY